MATSDLEAMLKTTDESENYETREDLESDYYL